MSHSSVADSANSVFEARLREEINQHTSAFPAMLHCIDEAGRVVSVSDVWLAKLGYSRDEVLGRPSVDFMTPESREKARGEVLPEFFRTGRCENVHYRLVRKDGGILDVLVSAVLADDPAARTAIAVLTDITALLETKRLLHESEARYRSLVEDQSEMVSLATPEGELRYVNSAYAQLYGRRPEQMVGKSLLNFVPPAQHDSVRDDLARACASHERVECENQIMLPNGETRWIAWTNRALTDPSGRINVIHSVGRDIQARVDAERRLQASEARYRFLAENSTDLILLVASDGQRIFASPASRQLLGYEPEEALALRLKDEIHPEDAPRVLLAIATATGETRLTYRMRRKDGAYIWVETTGKTVEFADGERQRLIIVRDVSVRKAMEDRLAEANARLAVLSSQDGLTGLANRRAFDEAMARGFRRSRPEDGEVALIMLDVDRFKTFNDIYGHPAGDDALRRIARAIQEAARRSGDLAARYGGEEFAVLLSGADESGVLMTTERIRAAVAELAIPHCGNEAGIVTISAGVALARVGKSAERLLSEADRALYRAKAAGRNRVTIAEEEGEAASAA